jgi:hypothetical protein
MVTCPASQISQPLFADYFSHSLAGLRLRLHLQLCFSPGSQPFSHLQLQMTLKIYFCWYLVPNNVLSLSFSHDLFHIFFGWLAVYFQLRTKLFTSCLSRLLGIWQQHHHHFFQSPLLSPSVPVLIVFWIYVWLFTGCHRFFLRNVQFFWPFWPQFMLLAN